MAAQVLKHSRQDYGELFDHSYIIPSSWLAAWTAALPIGNLLGSVAAGWIHDRFGRRLSLGLNAILASIGLGICYASYLPANIDSRRGVYLAGSLVVGTAIGGAICTAQTYISEVVPKTLRGTVFALFTIGNLVPQLISAIVFFHFVEIPGSQAYLTCLASGWPFGFVVLLVAIWMPESPAYLARKGELYSARKSQSRLHLVGVDTDAEVDQIFAVIAQEKIDSHVSGGEATYLQCFTGVDRRRTWIIVLVSLMPQLFGTSMVSISNYLLQTIGMSAVTAVMLLQVGIWIGIFGNVLAIWTLAAVRRRTLITVTLGIIALLWMGVGVAGFYSGESMLWYTAVAIILVLFFTSLGVWPACVVVASEASSLRLRGKAQAIGWMVQGCSQAIFAIVLPYIFNPDEGALGGKTCFIFFATSVIGLISVYFIVPEMKGRTSSEIDVMFNSKIPTRKFEIWQSGDMAEDEECGSQETKEEL